MSNENETQTMVQPRSAIADALTHAAAEATGLKPEQIITITAGLEQILITYTGAEPGMGGGAGRIAVRTYDTRTGAFISDHRVEDPAERARTRASVAARTRSLFAQDHA